MQHIITKHCLQTILNECLLTGNAKVTLGLHAFGPGPGHCGPETGEFRSMAGPRGLRSRWLATMQRKMGQDFLAQDVPGTATWPMPCALLCWCRRRTSNELMKEIKDIEARRKNPYRFPRMRCFAIDTNVAYNRLLTRLTSYGHGCGVVDFDPNSISVVVPDMVRT